MGDVISIATRRRIIPVVDGRFDLADVDPRYATDPRLMYAPGDRLIHEGRHYTVTHVDGTTVTLRQHHP